MKEHGKLIFVMGLPGSGKTYLARLIASHFGFEHVSSDRTRNDLNLMGRYETESKQLVYQMMLTTTSQLLGQGKDVVVDATFTSSSDRSRFRAEISQWTDQIFWVLVSADPDTTRKRLQIRRVDSEADYQVYLRLKDQFDPVDFKYLEIPTDQCDDDELLYLIINYCRLSPFSAQQMKQITILGERLIRYEETHISYVLLTDEHAYKVKKTVKFSFLDFSTIKRRKFFCIRELELNRRLAKGVYLDVVPIMLKHKQLVIGGQEGAVVDYAVKMKRLHEDRQMHLLLQKNLVTTDDIDSIAQQVSTFHLQSSASYPPFDPSQMTQSFNDILTVSDIVRQHLDLHHTNILDEAVQISNHFISQFGKVLEERIARGMIRDCHGDLHSRNIFLDPEPVIFDCLEFNDAFRLIDVIDELAFFCMDLEVEEKWSLSQHFIQEYANIFPEPLSKPLDFLVFQYYKLYRANVRAKVDALKLDQKSIAGRADTVFQLQKYLTLMHQYIIALRSKMSDHLGRPTREVLA